MLKAKMLCPDLLRSYTLERITLFISGSLRSQGLEQAFSDE